MKTILLANEWDSAAKELLAQVLGDMGATYKDAKWALGGSQEIATIEYVVAGADVRVESETYVGLSISGPEAVVEQVAAHIRGRRA